MKLLQSYGVDVYPMIYKPEKIPKSSWENIVSNELWFSPGSIKFNQEQMKWLLRWLPVLEQGQWPPNPEEGDQVGIHKQSSHAYFELPCTIAAEVEARIEMAGRDGFMCKDYYCYEEDERTLAVKYDCPAWRVRKRIARAMRYMSGKARKRISYKEWLKNGWKWQKKACYKKLEEEKHTPS